MKPSNAGVVDPTPARPCVPDPLGGTPSKRSVADAYTGGSAGAHLGHAPADSSGQPRLLADPSAGRLTCANTVDLDLVSDHTVYGIQEVRVKLSVCGQVTQLRSGLRQASGPPVCKIKPPGGITAAGTMPLADQ